MATSSALGLADLALTWSNTYGSADISIVDGDLGVDRGLMTAVILSLFTDRRAEDDDVPPSGDATDRRGWWGDEFLEIEGDKYGSRLWLLDRSKNTNEILLRAKEYALEALQWMIDDRVASSIDVTVSTSKTDPAAFAQSRLSATALLIAVGLQRPGKDPVTYRFAHTWEHAEEDV